MARWRHDEARRSERNDRNIQSSDAHALTVMPNFLASMSSACQWLSNTYQSVVIPGDALLLICVGVREALNLTSLASEQAVKIWADLVTLALLQCVALSASRLPGVSNVLLT